MENNETTQEFLIELGKKLKIIRKRQRYSVKTLARESGFTEYFIKQFEAGKLNNITSWHIIKLSDALHVGCSMFFRDLIELGKPRPIVKWYRINYGEV